MEQLSAKVQNPGVLIDFTLKLSKYLFVLSYLISIYPLSLILLMNLDQLKLNQLEQYFLLTINTQVLPQVKIDYYRAQPAPPQLFGKDVSAQAPDQDPGLHYSKLGLSSNFLCNTHISLVVLAGVWCLAVILKKVTRPSLADQGSANWPSRLKLRGRSLLLWLKSYLVTLHDNFLFIFTLGAILQFSHFNFLTVYNGSSFIALVLFALYYVLFMVLEASLLNGASLVALQPGLRVLRGYISLDKFMSDIQTTGQGRRASSLQGTGLLSKAVRFHKSVLARNYHLLTMGKKILLQIVIFMPNITSKSKLIWFLAICIVYMTFLMWLRPYNTRLLNNFRLANDFTYILIITMILINEFFYLRLIKEVTASEDCPVFRQFRNLSFMIFVLTALYLISNILYQMVLFFRAAFRLGAACWLHKK